MNQIQDKYINERQIVFFCLLSCVASKIDEWLTASVTVAIGFEYVAWPCVANEWLNFRNAIIAHFPKTKNETWSRADGSPRASVNKWRKLYFFILNKSNVRLKRKEWSIPKNYSHRVVVTHRTVATSILHILWAHMLTRIDTANCIYLWRNWTIALVHISAFGRSIFVSSLQN